jgi:hypothetical protein
MALQTQAKTLEAMWEGNSLSRWLSKIYDDLPDAEKSLETRLSVPLDAAHAVPLHASTLQVTGWLAAAGYLLDRQTERVPQ